MNAALPSNFGIQQRGKLPFRLISKEGTAAENSQKAGGEYENSVSVAR